LTQSIFLVFPALSFNEKIGLNIQQQFGHKKERNAAKPFFVRSETLPRASDKIDGNFS